MIASVTGKCLPVLLASIKAYVPETVELFIAGPSEYLGNHRCFSYLNQATNYGDAYNFLANKAFEYHDEIIIANDDVVLTPDTYRLLDEDVKLLKMSYKIGWVTAKSDKVKSYQNIRFNAPSTPFETQRVSPLFGYISRVAWIDYPPINWYSDDIQCIDMINNGYRHFVSRAYVHHVGSQTIGEDENKNRLASVPWIKQHRPELYDEWFLPPPSPYLLGRGWGWLKRVVNLTQNIKI